MGKYKYASLLAFIIMMFLLVRLNRIVGMFEGSITYRPIVNYFTCGAIFAVVILLLTKNHLIPYAVSSVPTFIILFIVTFVDTRIVSNANYGLGISYSQNVIIPDSFTPVFGFLTEFIFGVVLTLSIFNFVLYRKIEFNKKSIVVALIPLITGYIDLIATYSTRYTLKGMNINSAGPIEVEWYEYIFNSNTMQPLIFLFASTIIFWCLINPINTPKSFKITCIVISICAVLIMYIYALPVHIIHSSLSAMMAGLIIASLYRPKIFSLNANDYKNKMATESI